MNVASNFAFAPIACASREQRRLVGQIDLVQHQHLGLRDVRELRQDSLGLFVDALLGVDQQHDDVGVVRAAPGGGHHRAVEPAPRRENARRVHQDKLRVADDRDPAHHGARGLHLAGNDGDFGADQRVGQRRLAGVRRADQRDEAAAPLVRRRRWNIALAVSHSRLRLRASALRRRRPARPRVWSVRSLQRARASGHRPRRGIPDCDAGPVRSTSR